MRDRDLDYIDLNYKDIGIRIKAERARQGMRQERLAELADLSMTHMSHIENGTTKLSLSALHRVAWALGMPMDTLACDSIAQAKDIFESELLQHTEDCNETEIRIIADTIKALKVSLRKRAHKEL